MTTRDADGIGSGADGDAEEDDGVGIRWVTSDNTLVDRNSVFQAHVCPIDSEVMVRKVEGGGSFDKREWEDSKSFAQYGEFQNLDVVLDDPLFAAQVEPVSRQTNPLLVFRPSPERHPSVSMPTGL